MDGGEYHVLPVTFFIETAQERRALALGSCVCDRCQLPAVTLGTRIQDTMQYTVGTAGFMIRHEGEQ